MRVPQVRATAEPYRSSLMSFLDGNSDVLDRLITEAPSETLIRVPDPSRTFRRP